LPLPAWSLGKGGLAGDGMSHLVQLPGLLLRIMIQQIQWAEVGLQGAGQGMAINQKLRRWLGPHAVGWVLCGLHGQARCSPVGMRAQAKQLP
jgi:hypothetical protein